MTGHSLGNSDSGLLMINVGYGRFPPGSFMGRPEQMKINVQWEPPRERFEGVESLCTITPCVCLQRVSAQTHRSTHRPHHSTLPRNSRNFRERSAQHSAIVVIVVSYEICFCPCCGRWWRMSQVLDRTEHSGNNSPETCAPRILPPCPKCYLRITIPCSIQVFKVLYSFHSILWLKIKAIWVWNTDSSDPWRIKWRIMVSHLTE